MVNAGCERRSSGSKHVEGKQAGKDGIRGEPNRGSGHQSWEEGEQKCFMCVKRTCRLLGVRTSSSELSRATLVFRCSCSMGNRDRGRVPTGIPMTKYSLSVKAGECGQ